MNNELKKIKKIYGEEMMHLCRELFPSILEKEGRLLSILEKNLAPTHSFASDIREYNLYEKFKNWIYSFINVEKKETIVTNKTPFELMEEAGYTLYECKSEEEIQSFKKYYSSGEELCTFRGGRLNRCDVFFAVKKNVDEIKREDFSTPERQDKYGTSVMSIQFSRISHTLSIKNRYNHTVNNPDATFSNNLENIIPGLTTSFENYMKFKINQQEKEQEEFLTNRLYYVKGNDGKYYRYNTEINGIYYCENNIIIRNGDILREYSDNRERYLLIDNYIIDMKEKIAYDHSGGSSSFAWSIYDVGEKDRIYISKNGKNRLIHFCYKDKKEVIVEIDQNNAIIGYENNYVKEIESYFLSCSYSVKRVSLPNVNQIGDFFLVYNDSLESINLPNVLRIGNGFLSDNMSLRTISLPKVTKIGYSFLYHNNVLESIDLPNVMFIGDNFLSCGKELKEISLPKVVGIKDDFLSGCENLERIYLPNVVRIGSDFLRNNHKIRYISFLKVKVIDDCFLYINEILEKIDLPEIEKIRNGFLRYNNSIKEVNFPKLKKIAYNFLRENKSLKRIYLPSIEWIDEGFLEENDNEDIKRAKEEIIEKIKTR